MQQTKLLLDECLGKPLTQDIQQLLNWDTPPPIVRHLLDYFASGTPDPVWISRVHSEGWIILTADRGRGGKDKLPLICSQYQITHILMSSTVLKLKQIQKASAIISVWEEIKICGSSPKGSRFLLQLTPKGKPTIRTLVPVTP